MLLRQKMLDPAVVHDRRWLTLLVLCVSLLVIVVDNTILNVALPTLARRRVDGGLGASASQLQWIVDSYPVVFAGLLLTAGSLGDRFGRYKGLAFGLAVFGVGSTASALSTSANMLIATRALMGVGGAFIMPSTLSVLTNIFTDPPERAKAIGVWAGVSALGIGLGPVAGGVLLSHFWWGSVFLVNVPITIAGLVLGFLLVPESKDPAAPRLDPNGALLSIGGLTALLWAVIEAPSHGWTSPEVLAGFAIGALLLAHFLRWELACPSPMLNIRFFENPRFSAASGAITLTFFALFGTIFLLTQYLQSVLGYSTVKAGVVLVPQAVIVMITAPASSIWTRRFGNKVVISGGLLVIALALGLFTTLDPGSSTFHVVLVSALIALGMGNVMAPATDSIMGSLPRAKAGVGSAVNDTTRQVGGALGVAVLGSILSSQYSSSITSALTGKVPAPLLAKVRESVGAAIGVARTVPGARPFAPQVLDAARRSFVSGMHLAVLLGAAVTVIAALGVLRWLPARGGDEMALNALGPTPEVRAAPMTNGPGAVPPDGATDLVDVGARR